MNLISFKLGEIEVTSGSLAPGSVEPGGVGSFGPPQEPAKRAKSALGTQAELFTVRRAGPVRTGTFTGLGLGDESLDRLSVRGLRARVTRSHQDAASEFMGVTPLP